jgi:hypothetical protein
VLRRELLRERSPIGVGERFAGAARQVEGGGA